MDIRKIIAFTTAVVLAGCATVPFDSNRQVKIEGNFLTRSFTQNDSPVDIHGLFSQLKQNETTKDKASLGQIWFYTAMVSAGIGGYIIGFDLAKKSDSRESKLSEGLGFVGVSLVASYFADSNLVEAVEIHNQKLSNKKAWYKSMTPTILALQQDQQSLNPVLGFRVLF